MAKTYVFQMEGEDTDGFLQYEGQVGDARIYTFNFTRLVTVVKVRAEGEEEAWRRLNEVLESDEIKWYDVADGEPRLVSVEDE